MVRAREEILASFVSGFEQRLAELKEDFNTQGKVLKHAGFWKGYVHGRAMCALTYLPLEDIMVPRTKMEWAEWQVTGGPDYHLPVDTSDGEEENLEDDFPDFVPPSPLP